jgi:hypothetical protein
MIHSRSRHCPFPFPPNSCFRIALCTASRKQPSIPSYEPTRTAFHAQFCDSRVHAIAPHPGRAPLRARRSVAQSLSSPIAARTTIDSALTVCRPVFNAASGGSRFGDMSNSRSAPTANPAIKARANVTRQRPSTLRKEIRGPYTIGDRRQDVRRRLEAIGWLNVRTLHTGPKSGRVGSTTRPRSRTRQSAGQPRLAWTMTNDSLSRYLFFAVCNSG